jgi:hypothetical protein
MATADKQHVHKLIELMSPSQVPAAIGMLESLLDPVSLAIANAPIDDEPVTEEEEKALEESASGSSTIKAFRTSR